MVVKASEKLCDVPGANVNARVVGPLEPVAPPDELDAVPDANPQDTSSGKPTGHWMVTVPENVLSGTTAKL